MLLNLPLQLFIFVISSTQSLTFILLWDLIIVMVMFMFMLMFTRIVGSTTISHCHSLKLNMLCYGSIEISLHRLLSYPACHGELILVQHSSMRIKFFLRCVIYLWQLYSLLLTIKDVNYSFANRLKLLGWSRSVLPSKKIRKYFIGVNTVSLVRSTTPRWTFGSASCSIFGALFVLDFFYKWNYWKSFLL